jgi:hypothetical protein
MATSWNKKKEMRGKRGRERWKEERTNLAEAFSSPSLDHEVSSQSQRRRRLQRMQHHIAI